MMGLLDNLDDPKTAGLLSLGLGLLNSRGNFGQALGQAGQQAMQQMQAMKLAKQQEEERKQMAAMRQVQMQQAQEQLKASQEAAAERERQRTFLQNLPSPQMQASQAALAGGGGPTVANTAKMAPVDQHQQQLLDATRAGVLPYSSYLASMQKDETPLMLKPGETAVDRKTFKPLFTNPDKPTTTEVGKLISEMNALPPGHPLKAVYQNAISKATTHAPPTQVSVTTKMDNAFAGPFAEGAASMLKASREKASAAANTLRTIDRAEQALASGKVITGPAANFQTSAAQIGYAMGLGGKSAEETLANTRKLMQSAASLAVDGAQAMAGQGQITDRERELVNKMAGGDIDKMTMPEIRSTLATLKKVNKTTIGAHQQSLKNVDPKFQNFTPFYQVEEPQLAAPSSTGRIVDFGSLK